MAKRRHLAVLLLLLGMSAALSFPRPASSANPDRADTQTACPGYSDSVVRLYRAALGRAPEQGGFDFWLDEYTAGRWSLPRMAGFFAQGNEFLDVFGDLDPVDFVAQLYRNVLAREGEADGVTYWTDQMSAGMDRGTVVLRFAESPENIERTGTVPPLLGPFNVGRSGPWECVTDLFAVGDLTDCRAPEADVAAVLGASQAELILLGDLAYHTGSDDDFTRCFDPLYGPMMDRILPVLGNHEYGTAGAAPYFERFGDAAGQPGQGWYSVDRGRWQIIVLNSNCAQVGGCGLLSAQYQWLDTELKRRPDACRLVGFHHPRWTSYAPYDDNTVMIHILDRLYAAGTDLVLNGHVHGYERFEPMTPAGHLDPSHGIRSIIVGTGGKALRPFNEPQPGSVVRNADTYGALRLQLTDTGYTFTFVRAAGGTFTDAGSGTCINS